MNSFAFVPFSKKAFTLYYIDYNLESTFIVLFVSVYLGKCNNTTVAFWPKDYGLMRNNFNEWRVCLLLIPLR